MLNQAIIAGQSRKVVTMMSLSIPIKMLKSTIVTGLKSDENAHHFAGA